ncbi:hypothetical protein KP509_37G007600 [Ceratopteris richardii]|uniref:Uncharacterized protein n=1 Tax=Ceratopteris richardii TaxID=49495 RepID=A0A8T2Q6F1_CERRI|nr:hypothetical protein KP509_37G007600 [Ceratopteris richardii]
MDELRVLKSAFSGQLSCRIDYLNYHSAYLQLLAWNMDRLSAAIPNLVRSMCKAKQERAVWNGSSPHPRLSSFYGGSSSGIESTNSCAGSSDGLANGVAVDSVLQALARQVLVKLN